jgi:SEC-C motif-containing protein
MSEEQACPCGSGQPFGQCCGPYLDGSALPPTAEALMRSRYTAYTRQDDRYLLATWHPETRPDDATPSDDGDGSVWTGLEVLRTEAGGVDDEAGVVEFVAFCDINGTPAQLHETSTFQRQDGRWWYVDGEGQTPLRRDQPKVGRNEPCPCGSGKKYKKCCGG